jgi:23S rRNA (cytidine1920-2'-O)/16S rRNA (cytidine1409-2'-O)-methyltransferase
LSELTRKRLDVLLVEQGLLAGREAARAAIMDGGVLVDGVRITKPGAACQIKALLQLTGRWAEQGYVSRGGLKLARALAEFHIDVAGRTCLDIGASTGGFTDCLLRHGARRVYAVDVGYGQLDWSLRTNERVVTKERLNARYLTPHTLYTQDEVWSDLAVIDVSFISITKILPACVSVLASPDFEIIALIKPQFEAGRRASTGGVIRSPLVHNEVLTTLVAFAGEMGLSTKSLTHSPIKGPKGNIEFLALWSPHQTAQTLPDIARVVEIAHLELNRPRSQVDQEQ